MAQLYMMRGDLARATEEIKLEEDETTRLVVQAELLHLTGRRAESDAVMKTLVARFSEVYPFGIAEAYAVRGDTDLAFEWLDRALATGDPEASSAHLTPLMRGLHKDARWLPFLRKVGIAPEQLAKIKFNPKLPG
jgi:hypothetical protein